jgi:molecular chaperone DnaK
VQVLQGFRGAVQAEECVVLGNITMEVPPAPKGIPKFEVVFDVQSDGTMKAIVTDTSRERSELLDIVETRALALRDQEQKV